MANNVTGARRDSYGILSGFLFDHGERTLGFLVMALALFGGLSNLGLLGLSTGQGSAPASPVTASSYSTGTVTTEQLNLTQATANASRNFSESSWTHNSTTAQITINSSNLTGETVSAVWPLDQSSMMQAQVIRYNFKFASVVPTPGASGPRINASIELTSSTYDGWYSQSRTPIYPNNTQSLSVVNVEGQYSNGSSRSSLLFQAQRVTNAQANTAGGTSTTLFQRESPGYAAGDGVLHHYSIEIDLQSNTTVWIVDDTIIATSELSFVPSNIVFTASANTPGNLALATLKDPVQTATAPQQNIILVTTSSNGVLIASLTSTPTAVLIANLTNTQGQISSLRTQLDHLNSQVGNLTNQNSQLEAKNSQWFFQWWSSIIWGLLGAGLGGFFFVSSARLKRKNDSLASERDNPACAHCGGQMPPDATFCGECGTSLRETQLLCRECGEQMPAASTYCGDCGAQIPVNNPLRQNVAHTSGSEGPEEKEGVWR